MGARIEGRGAGNCPDTRHAEFPYWSSEMMASTELGRRMARIRFDRWAKIITVS
jgi:hypothetical protein